MRNALLAASIAAITLSGAAAAQQRNQPTYGYMPMTFQGTWQEWTDHQDLCAARFRSYDRSTDMYSPGNGRREFCSLGLTDITANFRAREAIAMPVNARVPGAQYGYMPLTYEGTWQEWTEHQDLCAARYRSFDRETDMYRPGNGRREFCNLGLKDAAPQARR